ncbi:hypothetical protein GGX14DRAFT_483767 [Mycena pura]|uniref:Uncharacterized protein n=1 Tax=Mycena pura TaxID=153505 RepID=A0AAD6XXX5_9AGAR|nr:hypothetical protein GGX14DRAFT_483767 [Mycena pura]
MSFPSLPPDIVRVLFECAAQSDVRTAASVSLVSKDVNEWVSSILYRSVKLGLPSDEPGGPLQTFFRTLESHSSRYTLVKHLAIQGKMSAGDTQEALAELIPRCPALVSVSVLPSDCRWTCAISLPAGTQVLAWEAWGLRLRLQNLTALHNLTHLHVHAARDPQSRSYTSALTIPLFAGSWALPALSHLALTIRANFAKESSINTTFSSLKDGFNSYSARAVCQLEVCVIVLESQSLDAASCALGPNAVEWIRGDYNDAFVVAIDEKFMKAHPWLYGLPSDDIVDWTDMRWWDKAEDHLRRRNAARVEGISRSTAS